MSWWTTLLGGTLGFVVGGPIGALLGAALGQSVGFALRGVEFQEADDDNPERTQVAFFTATFGVMGHVAKADGRVSPDEINLANQVMDHFGINEDQRRAAQAIFNEGKAPGFPLDEVLDQLHRVCGRATNLLRLFLEIQVQAAWADGGVHAEERRVLKHVASRLGFPDEAYDELERLVGSGANTAQPEAGPSLADAYATLGVAPDASDAEVKRAYRRLMNRHHPARSLRAARRDDAIRHRADAADQGGVGSRPVGPLWRVDAAA